MVPGTELLVLLAGFILAEVVLGSSFVVVVDDRLFTSDLDIVWSDGVLGVEVEIVLLVDLSLSRPQSMTRYTINMNRTQEDACNKLHLD